MPSQTGKNVLVALKAETTFNTAPSPVTGGTQLRIVSGGLGLKKTLIKSNEIRSDGQSSMARHGSRMVDGSYVCEVSLASFDPLFEAIMRSTWVAAVALTTTGAGAFVDVTANANNQLTRTGTGSWITDGVRVGDMIRLSNYTVAGDNNINLRVTAVSQFVITVEG